MLVIIVAMCKILTARYCFCNNEDCARIEHKNHLRHELGWRWGYPVLEASPCPDGLGCRKQLEGLKMLDRLCPDCARFHRTNGLAIPEAKEVKDTVEEPAEEV